MKILKKIITFILTITLTILISLLVITCTIKSTIIEGILYEEVKNTIFQKPYKEPNLTLDDIITEDGVITNNEFVNEILESKEIKELVNNYIDRIVTSIADEDASLDDLNDFDLEQDMINYIKENKDILSEKTGVEITDEMIDKASEKIDERDTKKVIKQTILNARNNITEEERTILKGYQFLTSTKLKIFTLIGILVNVLLIAVVQMSYYKWLKNLSYSMILGGIGTYIISIAIKLIVSSVMQNPNIQVNSMKTIAIIVAIFGIIIYVLYIFTNKYFIKDDENEISNLSN